LSFCSARGTLPPPEGRANENSHRHKQGLSANWPEQDIFVKKFAFEKGMGF
jgi:hypothetical protein